MLSLRQAMDRLFEDAWVRPAAGQGQDGSGAAALALDVYETNDDLVLTASVPGVKPEEIDITVQGDVLTIKGETKFEGGETQGAYHRQERRYGRFHRQIALPVSVRSDSATAQFENGVLTLRLPKAEEAKERRIPVQAGASHMIESNGH
jgi:HSP20 family protein